MPEEPSLRQFLLRLVVTLPACFYLWHLAQPFLALPLVDLADAALRQWFPSVVAELRLQGGAALLVTHFGADAAGSAVPPAQSEHQLAFLVNQALLSYALPFYMSLRLATPQRGYLSDLALGSLAIYATLLPGLISLCLKELLTQIGPGLAQRAGSPLPPGDAIAFSYQFSVLMLPTLVPVALWAWQCRDSTLLRVVRPAVGRE